MKIYAPTARAARRVECPRSDAAPDSAPADFNATAHPIISRHWFGVDPVRPIGRVAAEVVANLKRQRQIEHVDRLGARAVGEMLHQVAEGENLDRALAAYERLTPDLLKAVGGDSFPFLPIHAVRP